MMQNSTKQTPSPKASRLMWLGSALIGLMIVVAIFAPWIAPQDPQAMALKDRFSPPSFSHPFGLDENGSDVFAKVVYGARVSLSVALSVVTLSTLIGLLVGSVSGFLGSWVDNFIMRSVDLIYAFPNFLLALGLVAALGPSTQNVIIAMSLTGWASYARLVRGEVLHLKERDFIQSAESIGSSAVRQITLHIWPNLTGTLLVHCSFAAAGTVIAESGLSFLGLGAPPTTPTWGALLNAGRSVLSEAPHVSLFPGLAILILVLGFNLFGDGLRDYLDPKKN